MLGQVLLQRHDRSSGGMHQCVAEPEVAGERLSPETGWLQAQVLRYETAIDKIAQGVCFFDGARRLMLCNRHYA